MNDSIPGLVPVAQFPRFVPIDKLRIVELERDAATAEAERLTHQVRELFDEAASLRRQLAEAQQRPLLAVVAEMPKPANGRYPCPHCPKTFFSVEVLEGHLERVHAGTGGA